MVRVLTIVGARPQFIKASVVSKRIGSCAGLDEIVLHTGQHYDKNMSDIFFTQLDIPEPDIKLNINQGNHGEMTGNMLISIEQAILSSNPDRVLVYGDTNSTLAGALAAAKLNVPVAHVEAGLRSFNMTMPEEINRIVTDQISNLLFCPTPTAVNNLINEGFENKNAKIFSCGDVMQDATNLFRPMSNKPRGLINHQGFILSTIHRAENTNCPVRLSEIVSSLNRIHKSIAPVVLPIHPRTLSAINNYDLKLDVELIPPVGYLEMLWLLDNSGLVITDSGGLQKEAFFFNKFCLTLRDETEWVELIDKKVNVLAPICKYAIHDLAKVHFGQKINDDCDLYGGGNASQKIVDVLLDS